MNRDSEWRIGVAREIARVFAAHPDVLMVVAGGSAARGEADSWSDLDLSVHWKAVDGAWLETPRLRMVSVIGLVETHMPAVDTTAAKALLTFPMKPAQPPHGG